jgi:hypothetical protein
MALTCCGSWGTFHQRQQRQEGFCLLRCDEISLIVHQIRYAKDHSWCCFLSVGRAACKLRVLTIEQQQVAHTQAAEPALVPAALCDENMETRETLLSVVLDSLSEEQARAQWQHIAAVA